MAKLTERGRAFLTFLAGHSIPVPRGQMPVTASREEDRARQACRRAGYVEFVGGRLDGKDYPMGWRITDAGRRALQSDAEQVDGR